MKLGISTVTVLPEDMPDGKTIAYMHPASDKAVEDVLAQDETSPDGRSEWLWVRLANGDLVLGVFPQGDTYFAHEDESSTPLGVAS